VASFLGEANFLPGHAADATVATELGVLIATLPAAGAVDALIRPEAVHLIASESGPATVTETEYFGHDCMYSVLLASGTRLKCRVAGESPIRLGDRVRVEIGGPVATFPRAG
jgi:iron(III) transport system ATP-binding protein